MSTIEVKGLHQPGKGPKAKRTGKGKKGTQERKEDNMKIRRGLNGGHYKPLSEKDVEKIYG